MHDKLETKISDDRNLSRDFFVLFHRIKDTSDIDERISIARDLCKIQEKMRNSNPKKRMADMDNIIELKLDIDAISMKLSQMEYISRMESRR